jgi:hypothetical protein
VRSLALTLAVGAAVLGACTLRPGFAGFAIASTLGFFVAGLLWSSDEPSGGHRRPAVPRPAGRMAQGLLGVAAIPAIARSYRVSASR